MLSVLKARFLNSLLVIKLNRAWFSKVLKSCTEFSKSSGICAWVDVLRIKLEGVEKRPDRSENFPTEKGNSRRIWTRMKARSNHRSHPDGYMYLLNWLCWKLLHIHCFEGPHFILYFCRTLAVDCGDYLHLNLFLSPLAMIKNGIHQSPEPLLETFTL